jgi:putative restriction endonuclease
VIAFDRARDAAVRSAVFEWLGEQVDLHGDVLPWDVLKPGVEIAGERVKLLGPQGIFKPRILALPLSITTAPDGPYNDAFGPDGLLRYKYRGTDPTHRDNEGLRTAMRLRIPLVYFHGIATGKYMAFWPAYIRSDDRAALEFDVEVDDIGQLSQQSPYDADAAEVHDDSASARREYITRAVRVRLHQRTFRERVLAAYRRQCSFCQLRHEELLDAAHIIRDSHPEGEPRVSNGLALCSLHHKAFDRNFVGVRPDFVVEVRRDILEEHDGPTLVHGLQRLHGSRLALPNARAAWQDERRLDARYHEFREAAAG